jgi:hypothetical protein
VWQHPSFKCLQQQQPCLFILKQVEVATDETTWAKKIQNKSEKEGKTKGDKKSNKKEKRQ